MEYHVSTPLLPDDIKRFRIGDILYLSGTIFTARDKAHQKLLMVKSKKDLPFAPSAMALYHCGPLMKKTPRGWQVVTAGPTTSSRMNPFEDTLIKKYGVRFIIGKGGMDEKTQDALAKYQAVYTAFTGGAGVVAADAVVSVPAVYWLDELGMTEAVWVFQVKNFGPLVVAMDCRGNSLYQKCKE